ncbi:MAG: hypothetical protein HZC02_00945 [Candidatus Levybacteria bacterium]|nr:hypothetical protein [Candidatus Levybacteria bacterium]
MNLSFFHLNIQTGRNLEQIIDYVKKESFDIIHFQEVSRGIGRRGSDDTFAILKKELGYQGELAISLRIKNEETSYFGNATLYKNGLQVKNKKIIWLNPYVEFTRHEISMQEVMMRFPRLALALQFQLKKEVWFVNTHLAWGPTPEDKPYKIEQGKILSSFISTLEEPFVLSGDFNVTKSSQIIKDLNTFATNHAEQLSNTLNPRLHRVTSLFPPGLAVDFIYTNKLFTSEFSLVNDVDLSDHFGLKIKLDI